MRSTTLQQAGNIGNTIVEQSLVLMLGRGCMDGSSPVQQRPDRFGSMRLFSQAVQEVVVYSVASHPKTVGRAAAQISTRHKMRLCRRRPVPSTTLDG